MENDRDYLKEGKKNIEDGELQKAVYNLKHALEEHPDYPDIHNLIGVSLSLSGRYREAEKYLKKAIDLNPQYIEAHINLALTLNQLGKLEEARKEFEVAESLEMSRDAEKEHVEFSVRAKIANSHKDTAKLYASIDRYEEAVAELNKALRYAPNFHDIRTLLGEMLMKEGELEKAEDEFKEVLKRNDSYVPAAVKLGLCYYRSGINEKAKRIWEKALKLDPTNKTLRVYLDLLKE